jgi:hypothetical protein
MTMVSVEWPVSLPREGNGAVTLADYVVDSGQ